MTKQKPASAYPTTDSACQSNGATQNCSNSLYHTTDSSASPLDALLDALADKLAERLQAPPQDIWTVGDLAKRYGVSGSTIRRKMAAGEFGSLVHLGEKLHVATWEGVQAYEASHTGPIMRMTPQQRRAHSHRQDLGPI